MSFFIGKSINGLKNLFSGDILKIIIPNKLKRTIIDELAVRGIGETFIYPSLDNYCKEIKSKAKQIFDAREEEYSYYSAKSCFR